MPFKIPDVEEVKVNPEPRLFAHYDNAATNVKLTYIGTSDDHDYLVRKELPTESLTYSLFKD